MNPVDSYKLITGRTWTFIKDLFFKLVWYVGLAEVARGGDIPKKRCIDLLVKMEGWIETDLTWQFSSVLSKWSWSDLIIVEDFVHLI